MEKTVLYLLTGKESFLITVTSNQAQLICHWPELLACPSLARREIGKVNISGEDIKRRKGVENGYWIANKKCLIQQGTQNIKEL